MRIFILLFFICLYNCVSEPKTEQDIATAVLFFKAEQSVEVWNAGNVQNAIFHSTINSPIGIYDWEKGLKIFQNEKDTIYLATLQLDKNTLAAIENLPSFTPIFIFPSDARESKNFLPCMQCPYQTAMLYSTLWLYLQEFITEE